LVDHTHDDFAGVGELAEEEADVFGHEGVEACGGVFVCVCVCVCVCMCLVNENEKKERKGEREDEQTSRGQTLLSLPNQNHTYTHTHTHTHKKTLTRSRLIQKQNRRIRKQFRRDGHTLPLPTRDPANEGVGAPNQGLSTALQPHVQDDLLDPLLCVCMCVCVCVSEWMGV
jgi:hypothetical protein